MSPRRAGLSALLALVLMGGLAAPVHAVRPDEVLPDAALESRARTLSRELRCLVCQNENIDESNAPLARDLRVIVRERLTAGDSDAQVIEFLVARYGEFVLLRPRLSTTTIVLWATPVLALLIGGWIAASVWRRRQEAAGPALTGEEEARLAALLANAEGQRSTMTKP